MSTIGTGTSTTLVIVDVQVGVMAACWEAARIVQNLAIAIDRARAASIPVIWVQHASDELPKDSAAWQLVPELAPSGADHRIDKRFSSSFEATTLNDILTGLETAHIVLAGAQSNWCIRATAYAALDRGYDVTLLHDAHTTESINLGNGSRVEASDIVADLNVTMQWLSYPDRTNSVIAACDVDFASAANSRQSGSVAAAVRGAAGSTQQ
jgi:isochorismate hydrolase